MAEIEKMQPLRVEIAKEGDAKAVQELIKRSWIASFPERKDAIEEFFKDTSTDAYLARAGAILANPPENEKCLVAKEDTAPVGFCRTIRRELVNEIGNIHAPGPKRDMIGSAIWKEARRVLDMNKDTFTWVGKADAASVAFYEGLGFEQTKETRPDPRIKGNQTTLQVKMVFPKQEEQTEKVYL